MIAKRTGEAYGVLWRLGAKSDAAQAAVDIINQRPRVSYYVGVAKNPVERYYERGSAHRVKYQTMYVLCVGKRMGELERQVIARCKASVRGSTCDNKSAGGEFCNAGSTKFLYVGRASTGSQPSCPSASCARGSLVLGPLS